jgi:peptidyl-prolyl cis-trans isomerase C
MKSLSLRKKKSKKVLISAAVVAATIFAVWQLFFCCENQGKVIAKINGEKIYEAQIQNKLALMLGVATNDSADLPKVKDLPASALEILAKEVYFDEELAKIAKKSRVSKNDEVRNRINNAKNSILRQAYIENIIKEETSEERISQKYNELSNEINGKKEYLISHILLKDEEGAKKLYENLQAKKISFNKAVKKYSLDKESASDNGKLGFVLENNLIPEIANEISKLKLNEISLPIKTEFGIHIVTYSEVKDAKALPFEEVKENIRQELIKEILDSTKDNILKDAKIIIIENSAKKQQKESGEAKEIKDESSDKAKSE